MTRQKEENRRKQKHIFNTKQKKFYTENTINNPPNIQNVRDFWSNRTEHKTSPQWIKIEEVKTA